MTSDAYRQAGVDIDAGNRAVQLMKAAVRSTHTAAVLAEIGSFGGLFALDALPARPVLVASTDGVGTKVKLAAEWGAWQSIGHDIVNHCVDDILVQNARPLFFLDYIAASRLEPERVAQVVTGISEACRAVGCALLGGETAEMPGVYAEGAFDLAGTIVGIVDRDHLLPRTGAMQAGDLLFALPSSGPHTNGYSLIRRVLAGRSPDERLEDGRSLREALLAPHRCYLDEVERAQAAGIDLLGMAHITGGGLLENLPRVLPTQLAAEIDLSGWQPPALFRALVAWAAMSGDEPYRVFNMGVGMVLIVAAAAADRLRQVLPEAWLLGRLAPRAAEPVRLLGAHPAPSGARA